MENDDTQLRYNSRKKNKSIQRLYDSLNRINRLITEARLKNQQNEEYYKALIQQSATGLVAMDIHNKVEIANNKACELTGIKVPGNFERLKIKYPDFWTFLCELKTGQSETFKTTIEGNSRNLLIQATGLRFGEKAIKLIAIQDIKHVLDARETESWQKLISILTHEIMNSIAPITSLTSTLTKFFRHGDNLVSPSEVDEKVIQNTINGLDIISERGRGLLNFVSNYRRLTRIPAPVFADIEPHSWLNNLKILLTGKLSENNISLDIHIARNVQKVHGDEKLLTQVLINLIYNAIDALCTRCEGRKISLSVEKLEHNTTRIVVENNGAVIDKELHDKIFVPFFTTKENGSGIGLSLSRQIVQLHHGYIHLETNAEVTRFVIVL